MPPWVAHWLRDTRLLLGSQLLVVVSTTALAIILARTLGPSDWGLFSALLGVSLALGTFVDLGLGTWLLRELSRVTDDQLAPGARDYESSRQIIGAVLANGAFGSLVFIGAGVVVAVAGAKAGTAIAILALITYTVLVTASNCLEAFLRAERRLKTVVSAVLVERFLLLALASAATILLDFGIWAIGCSYLVAGFARVSFVGFMVFVKRRLPTVWPALKHVRGFVFEGVPFAFNTVALNVIPRLDTLLVTVLSATAAGYFALGDRIVGPALIVPVVASTALYPFLAREKPGSRTAWKISAGAMLVGFGGAALGAALAPIVILPVFGPDYADAVPVVQIMFFVVPFVYASNPLLAHLYSSGRERQVLASTLVASIVGTVAVLGGQISVGATGAAGGYVLRQLLFTLTLGGIAGVHRVRSSGLGSMDVGTGPLIGDRESRE